MSFGETYDNGIVDMLKKKSVSFRDTAIFTDEIRSGVGFKIKLGQGNEKIQLKQGFIEANNRYKRIHYILLFGYIFESGATFSRYTEQ